MLSEGEMEADAWDKTRTVVVSGVPNALAASRMIDKLTIHFQSCRRSHGGDVEEVRYPTNSDGVAFVAFDKAEVLLADAERVVRKQQHIMTDDEFPDNYLLTVFPFTRDVFLYVPRATVNLSIFGRDQAALIQSLQSAHRSLRFRPLLEQRKATIEGPFTAVKALREDLICRASQLQSVQTSPFKLRETPLNPTVISHHEVVGSVSCSGSNTKLEPASSNSLSTALQTTGEGTEVQSLLSNAKPQNASLRQKVSNESLTAGSFCDTQSDEIREKSPRPKLEMPTEYRPKTKPRQFREEISAGIASSLSGMDLLPAEGVSAKNPGDDDVTQKSSRPDRISATMTIRESKLGSRYSSTDRLKESHQNSSAITAELLQTGLKDVLTSSEGDVSAICPEDPEDTCIWVDSNIFKYIEKFHKKALDRCLRGLHASTVDMEGTDLMQILLTEKQTSKTASRIQGALENLKSLVEFQQSILRVHQIDYDEEEQPDRKKLIEICDYVNSLYDDVLYMLEESHIKIIGPSFSSHRFYKGVEDRIRKLKDTLVNH
ncbi:uncharacterized protein LOC123974223 isoform X1 [Micropterus dolomieu]|uniref:uncharacterized protein LOC123974223 isoform X1 n=1 Tax=Micropterus dolomieu TaxID=147949 RepID=UPI001E8D8BC7|nr:uncharacterized protein LOC123974223 isoform X1 [Micropterus dolomieu]